MHGKVYVAGHTGLVGSAIVRALQKADCQQIVVRRHSELDLTDAAATEEFFAQERPEYVFLAAAKVGGIEANRSRGAEFIHVNLMIQTNVIGAAHRHGVRKLMFLGSSCIYPRMAKQPITESSLLTGPLERTNEPYAIAKIAGIKMCHAFNQQYGTDYLCAMPTNVYGPGDDYDLETSHVLPALLHKAHLAKIAGAHHLDVWGSGRPMREFIFSDDLASACVYLMQNFAAADVGELVNVGVGRDISIADLARLVCDVVGFEGELRFDPTKPDGTPRKLLDVSKLKGLGWTATTSLETGLKSTYADFLRQNAS